MIEVFFSKKFVRLYAKLDQSLKSEVKQRIELLKDQTNHTSLKVHKLHGPLEDSFSFSINRKLRILFKYLSDSKVILVAIDDHDIYKR